MWKASGYSKMPTYDEVVEQDPDWISDILLAQEISDWVNNKATGASIGDGSPIDELDE